MQRSAQPAGPPLDGCAGWIAGNGSMRIINSVLGDATGGRWQVVCDYSRVLTQAGHQVLLLLDHRYLPDTTSLPSAVELQVIRNRGHYDYLAAWRLAGLLRSFAPDVAIAHCSRSVALLKRALRGSAPLIAVSHSNKVRRLLDADACIALTGHIRRNMEKDLAPGTEKPLFVIPNMIESGERTALPDWSPADPPRIGAMGRFDRVKGFDLYIEALGILRQRGIAFQAVLAGSGAQEAELKQRAAQLNLSEQLSFAGWIQDRATFLAGIDLLCVPARSDAFGLTPLEAAVAGVPQVLSTASGHVEMYHEGQVLFATNGNPVAFADGMRHLIELPQQARQLREAAFRRVQECYSVPQVTGEILQAIDITIENF